MWLWFFLLAPFRNELANHVVQRNGTDCKQNNTAAKAYPPVQLFLKRSDDG